jgi:hypothetical protein
MITARRVAGVQAAYYVVTGLWSIVHRRSFERITGRKREYWLVRTVGALAVAIGAALGLAAGSGRRREGAALALGSGAAFVASDLQAARSSSRVYLADAVLHFALLPAWLRDWPAGPREPQ